MRDDNTRNTIIFFVCAALLLMVYQFFVIAPQDRARQAEAAAVADGALLPAGRRMPPVLRCI